MEFETEEQQVEALKKWWKENGKQIIFGAIIGFGLIIGWRYYLDYSSSQRAEASALFEQVVSVSDDANQAVDKAAVFEKIKKDYSDTTYYSSAGLVLAKTYYDAGKKVEAIAVLDELLESKGQEVVLLIASERKARILIDLGKYDEALTVLSIDVKAEFKSIYEELKGDAYVAKGDIDNAKNAYDKALKLNTSGRNNLLQMKRDDLGESLSMSPAA